MAKKTTEARIADALEFFVAWVKKQDAQRIRDKKRWKIIDARAAKKRRELRKKAVERERAARAKAKAEGKPYHHIGFRRRVRRLRRYRR